MQSDRLIWAVNCLSIQQETRLRTDREYWDVPSHQVKHHYISVRAMTTTYFRVTTLKNVSLYCIEVSTQLPYITRNRLLNEYTLVSSVTLNIFILPNLIMWCKLPLQLMPRCNSQLRLSGVRVPGWFAAFTNTILRHRPVFRNDT
jgi:hypothetical protein